MMRGKDVQEIQELKREGLSLHAGESGATRRGFRGEDERDSGLIAKGIPGGTRRDFA